MVAGWTTGHIFRAVVDGGEATVRRVEAALRGGEAVRRAVEGVERASDAGLA